MTVCIEAMSRDERADYFRDHGPVMAEAQAELARAIETYARIIKSCACHERSPFDVERYVSDAIELLNRPLAEEMRDYLDRAPSIPPLPRVGAVLARPSKAQGERDGITGEHDEQY